MCRLLQRQQIEARRSQVQDCLQCLSGCTFILQLFALLLQLFQCPYSALTTPFQEYPFRLRQQQTSDSGYSVARVKGHREDYLGAVGGLNKNVGIILRVLQPFVVDLPRSPLHGEGFKHVTQEAFALLSSGATRLDHSLNPEVYSLVTHKPPDVLYPSQFSSITPRGLFHSWFIHSPGELAFALRLFRNHTKTPGGLFSRYHMQTPRGLCSNTVVTQNPQGFIHFYPV